MKKNNNTQQKRIIIKLQHDSNRGFIDVCECASSSDEYNVKAKYKVKKNHVAMAVETKRYKRNVI